MTICIKGKEISPIWVLRNRQDLTPGRGSSEQTMQRREGARGLGSSSEKAFVWLLLASWVVYFWCGILLMSFLSSGKFVQEKVLKVC